MKIGIFDSGYGGLTILEAVRKLLPQYDYVYLGDNATAPYGSRSFDVIYHYTWQAVQYLFAQHCALVLLACNTASAKALRSIQQLNLPLVHQKEVSLSLSRRVLGVIRPTVEAIPSTALHVGILATAGTVSSKSYELELSKINPKLVVIQQACPLWVPLIEANELDGQGTLFFIDKYLHTIYQQDNLIDTLILACTHYPLILPLIQTSLKKMVNEDFIKTLPTVITQSEIVAKSLKDYLNRHPEINSFLSQHATCLFYTTETKEKFQESASIFINQHVEAEQIHLKNTCDNVI